MDKKFDSFAYVEQVGVDLVNDFEKARRGTTPTLVGSAMEKATRDKLNQLLPRALAAGFRVCHRQRRAEQVGKWMLSFTNDFCARSFA